MYVMPKGMSYPVLGFVDGVSSVFPSNPVDVSSLGRMPLSSKAPVNITIITFVAIRINYCF